VIDTSEYKFARKVAKLNLNIVTVCLANGVEPARIRPCQTLHNVSLLGRVFLAIKQISTEIKMKATFNFYLFSSVSKFVASIPK
jgi:hypothetical protein